MKGLRFSLLTLLVAATLLGAGVGLWFRHRLNRCEYHLYISTGQVLRHGLAQYPFNLEACWCRQNGKERLEHLVLYPHLWRHRKDVQVSEPTAVSMSPTSAAGPPLRLFDMRTVDTRNGHRVFVLMSDTRELRPIEVQTEDLAQLNSANIGNLQATNLWKTKLLPLLVQETERNFASLGIQISRKVQAARSDKND